MLKALSCPQCGAPLRIGDKECEYCNSVIVDPDAETKIKALNSQIDTFRFEINAAEMASAMNRYIPPLPGGDGGVGGGGAASLGNGGRGTKGYVIAFGGQTVLEIDE